MAPLWTTPVQVAHRRFHLAAAAHHALPGAPVPGRSWHSWTPTIREPSAARHPLPSDPIDVRSRSFAKSTLAHQIGLTAPAPVCYRPVAFGLNSVLAVQDVPLEVGLPDVRSALQTVNLPVARHRPLPPLLRETARGLRRLFWRERGPDFLADRTPERLLLDLLRAPDRSSAEALASSLGPLFLEPDQSRLVQAACDLAAGSLLADVPWDADPALDALRARLVLDLGPQEALERTGAQRLLSWLGSFAPLPPGRSHPAMVAACASRHGWPAALARALGPAPGLSVIRQFDVASLTAMRCIQEGRLRLQWLPPLLPPPSLGRRHDLRGRSPWAAALVALEASARKRDDGAFHLAVALAASAFRLAMVERARHLRLPFDVTGWDRGPVSHRETFANVACALLDGGWTPHASPSPWRAPWPPFRTQEFEQALVEISGLPARQAWLLLVDDRLATAVGFALMGATPSARAVLASSPFVPALRDVALALDAALDRPIVDRSPLELLLGALDAEARQEVAAACEPDPSVVLGAPYWMVRTGYAATVEWLMRNGRGKEFRDVRRMLSRRDLEERASRYWLLTEAHDAELRGAISAAARRAPMPDDGPFLALLEKTWTTIKPKTPRSRQ